MWSADGRNLFFTSDRAGSPQVYQIAAQAGARPKRITFGSSLQRPPARVARRHAKLAMVTLDNGSYRIAVQELASNTVRILSHGRLDESPSFAPNGATLIYAERDGSRGALATVSPRMASRVCALSPPRARFANLPGVRSSRSAWWIICGGRSK